MKLDQVLWNGYYVIYQIQEPSYFTIKQTADSSIETTYFISNSEKPDCKEVVLQRNPVCEKKGCDEDGKPQMFMYECPEIPEICPKEEVDEMAECCPKKCGKKLPLKIEMIS